MIGLFLATFTATVSLVLLMFVHVAGIVNVAHLARIDTILYANFIYGV